MKRSRTSAAIAIAIATSFTMGCSTIEVVDVQQLDTNSHKSKEFIIINNDDVWRNDFVMMTFNEFYSSAELLRTPSIKALYSSRTERTFYRDIASLIDKGYMFEDDGKLKLTI